MIELSGATSVSPFSGEVAVTVKSSSASSSSSPEVTKEKLYSGMGS